MSYHSRIETAPGKKTKNDIMVFSLSTCYWCDKVKELFAKQGASFNYVIVDALEKSEQDEVMAELEKYTPNVGFPIIKINNGEKIIVGFDEEELIKLANE